MKNNEPWDPNADAKEKFNGFTIRYKGCKTLREDFDITLGNLAIYRSVVGARLGQLQGRLRRDFMSEVFSSYAFILRTENVMNYAFLSAFTGHFMTE